MRVRLDELTEGLETRTEYENWLNTTLSVAQRMTPGHLSRAADLEPDGRHNGTEIACGGDYAHSVNQWRAAFLVRRTEVLGLGFDQRFLHIWEFYLAYCEAAFRTGDIELVQLTLQK